MLYLLIRGGQVQRVVDSATDLDRMPVQQVKAMCRDLGVEWRGVDGELVRIHPVRPGDVVAWDVERPKRRRHVGMVGHR